MGTGTSITSISFLARITTSRMNSSTRSSADPGAGIIRKPAWQSAGRPTTPGRRRRLRRIGMPRGRCSCSENAERGREI